MTKRGCVSGEAMAVLVVLVAEVAEAQEKEESRGVGRRLEALSALSLFCFVPLFLGFSQCWLSRNGLLFFSAS